MKKRVLISLLLAVVLMVSIPVAVFATTSNTNTPVLNVEARNLSLKDNVQLVFYVSYENVNAADVKLLAWTSAQSSYTVGTQDATLTTVGTTTYNDKTCLLFYYTDMTAKQMTDDLYVRAYTEQGDNVYYSDVAKFSILEYAYTKLGKIGDKETDSDALKALLNEMLEYGAAAQTYLNYKTDCLATAEFYQITLTNGTLPNGMSTGLYPKASTVAITAPAQDGSGNAFAGWIDKNGSIVGETATYSYTVGSANVTLTAVYGSVSEVAVNVVNGTLASGDTSAEVCTGTQLTLSANKVAKGFTFSHWENSAGETVGTEKVTTITVTGEDTYKAYYVPFFGETPKGQAIMTDIENDWQQGGSNGSYTSFDVGSAATKHRVSFAEPVFLPAGTSMSVNLPKYTGTCPWETDGNTSTTEACADGCELTAALLLLKKNDTVSDTDFIPGYTLVRGGWQTNGFDYTANEDIYVMVTVKYSLHGSVAFNLEHECMDDITVELLPADLDYPVGTYWKDELTDSIDKIEEIRKTSDSISEFFFLTDSHWPDNAGYSPALINYMAEKLGTDNIIFGGDIIRRYNPVKQDAIDNEINAFYTAMEGLTKVGEDFKIFTALGNHDRNGSSNSPGGALRLTEQEAYDLYMKRVEEFGTTVEGDSNKSYFDDTTNKVRYIQFYFAGSQHGMIEDAFVDAGLAWTEEKIKELESDWTVILITHGVFCGAEGTENEYTAKDKEVIRRILKLQGEADAEIALWMSGHIHEDRNEILYDTDGNKVRLVSLNCDAWGNSNSATSYTMKPGSIMEQSLSFMQVDTANEVIYLTRVGAGGDLTYNFGSKLEEGTVEFPAYRDLATVKVINGKTQNGLSVDSTIEIDSTITLTADTISGYTFSHWVDKNGNTVASTATASFTVTGPNTYKAVYTANSTITTVDLQILADLANDWQQGSYDGKFAAWSEGLRGTRVTSKVIELKKGETISATFPESITCPFDCESGTCKLAFGYAVLTPVDGSNTGDLFTDYTVSSSTWKYKRYTELHRNRRYLSCFGHKV